MWDIRREVLSAAKKYNIRTMEIPVNETSGLMRRVSEKFAEGYSGRFLWDYLKPSFTLYGQDSWKYIGAFPNETMCYMFFDPHDSNVAFSFHSLRDVVMIISDSIAFEFYVTNVDLDYVFAFGHEDVLVACGSAADWLCQRVQDEKR